MELMMIFLVINFSLTGFAIGLYVGALNWKKISLKVQQEEEPDKKQLEGETVVGKGELDLLANIANLMAYDGKAKD